METFGTISNMGSWNTAKIIMNTQIIINTILSGSTFLLVALGFVIIYQIVRFFHFAHAVVFTAGAYFVYLFSVIAGYGFLVSIPLAILLTGLLGCLMELGIYKPLRKRGSHVCNYASFFHLVFILYFRM